MSVRKCKNELDLEICGAKILNVKHKEVMQIRQILTTANKVQNKKKEKGVESSLWVQSQRARKHTNEL